MFMSMLQSKERKTQQKTRKYGQIIYQSDGNPEPVDQAKGRDQPKSSATTNSHFRSKLQVTLSFSLDRCVTSGNRSRRITRDRGSGPGAGARGRDSGPAAGARGRGSGPAAGARGRVSGPAAGAQDRGSGPDTGARGRGSGPTAAPGAMARVQPPAPGAVFLR
ncbi:hypothetical protein Rs2_35665 [Raphanus sativus]|nr:hypothetical protein Rs2_35665 [Raphanus sativus]